MFCANSTDIHNTFTNGHIYVIFTNLHSDLFRTRDLSMNVNAKPVQQLCIIASLSTAAQATLTG